MRDATKLDIYFKDDKALFLIPLISKKIFLGEEALSKTIC